MTVQTRTIAVAAYRTPEGKPTCSIDWPAGMVCRFMGTRVLGQVAWCFATYADIEREGGDGYLLPSHDCPIWSEQK